MTSLNKSQHKHRGSKQTHSVNLVEFDLQKLLDAIPFYFMLLTADHKILLTNKAIRSDLGLEPNQIIGGYCPKLVHGLDEPYPGCPLEEAIEKGHGIEREFFNPETDRWVNSAIYPTGERTQEGQETFIHFISDITDRKKMEEEIRRNYDIQMVTNCILRLSLEDIPLEELLEQALDLILSIPWLALESRGGIFLVEDTPGVLVMKSQRGLSETGRNKCARIPFGKCHCGQAALTQDIQFADRIDERHEILHEGMTSHGHYCVPILSAGKTLGVINLYLREGHSPDKKEKEFLTAIANSLATIIERKRIELALRNHTEELRTTLLRIETLEKIKDHIAKFVPSSVTTLAEQDPDQLATEKVPMDVSILFIDIEGFSEITEAFDQRLLNDMVEHHFSRYLECVERHGGEVNETSGDGLMVIFKEGTPESNAREAVAAGLEIVSENKRSNDEFSYPWGRVDLHLGVNSGQAWVGTTKMKGLTGERFTYTASGLATVVASRIGALSKENRLYVGPETFGFVRDAFIYEFVGPRELKNVKDPIPIYWIKE